MADPFLDALRQVGGQSKKASKTVSRAARQRATRPAAPAARGSSPSSTLLRKAHAGAQGKTARRRPTDDDIEAITRAYLGSQRTARPAQPEVRTGGPNDLQRLLGATGGGRTLGGAVRNAAGDALDIATSVPAQAQLVAEAMLYPVVAGYNAATGGGLPGPTQRRGGTASRPSRVLQNKLEDDLTAAATAIKDDYVRRYKPILQGDWDEAGRLIYEDGLFYVLDAAGGKAAVGRAPNVVRRATRRVTPNSPVGMRADRRLSTLSAAEREQVAGLLGKSIDPGDGGRYRAPRVVTSQIARAEPGKPDVGQTSIEVPRRPYSGNNFARRRQQRTDRLRERFVPRIEQYAEARQVTALPVGSRPAPLRTRAVARSLRPFTAQGKFDKATRRATYTLRDMYDARAEVSAARSQGRGKSALARLRPDKDPITGQPRRGLSAEEAAFYLHSRDILDESGGRAGKTNAELRDLYVSTVEGNQRASRAKGNRTENSAAQLAAIRGLSEDLLDISNPTTPAARRVAAAVAEARGLNARGQLRSIEAGVVRPATVQRAAERDSAITLAGQRWGRDAITKATRAARVKSQGIKKAIARAQARGDAAEVKRLKGEYARHVAATKGRIAAIRRDATESSPQLTAARQGLHDAEAKLRAASTSGKPSAVSAATRDRDRAAARVRKAERDALGFTSPRRPELVGRKGIYVPDKPVDVRDGYTGPRAAGRFSGPDQARRSQGRLKARGNIDMAPALVAHQHERAMQNYTGRISRQALDELLDLAAYRDPKTGKPITGDRLRMLSAGDSQRVRLVHVGNLQKALKDLDDLADGRFLDDGTARKVFADEIPDGARAGDYVAISKAAAAVWTEAMTTNSFLKKWDSTLNIWKGMLLALSPRWYVNNTFGLALQYGLMAGVDVKAIRSGSLRSVRQAMEKRSPNTVKDTHADDLTRGQIPKGMAFGFRINSRLEEFWRRSAYMNRVKKAIRDEGGRFRKMSEADLARFIERMPESMARDIARDVDFFIGNYRKFTKAEQDIAKRVIPFYSWLRVIARLTFVLPFRSPLRVQMMAILSKAQEAGINPVDDALEYYERGSLRFGEYAIPTWGLNPWQTLAPALAAMGKENPGAALLEESIGWVHPIIQLAYSQAAGTNTFGQGVISPPGTAPFGLDPQSINEVTGTPNRQKVRVPWQEAILNTLAPGQVSLIRRAAADGRTPYGTTTTPDVLVDFFHRQLGGDRNEALYMDESPRKGRKPTKANVLTAGLGAPVYKQDDAAVIREFKTKLRKFAKEQRSLAKTRRRENRG